MTSNARVTAKITRLCLHSLNPTLQSYGGAIAHNLAIRRVRVMHRPLSSEDEVLIQACFLTFSKKLKPKKLKVSQNSRKFQPKTQRNGSNGSDLNLKLIFFRFFGALN